jgi:hypothetical protein
MFIEEFDKFVESKIKINQSRIDKAKGSIDAITNCLKSSELFEDYFIRVDTQGSLRHKTIIKPNVKKDEFDADILLYLKEVGDWTPKDYINKLNSELKKFYNYEDISSRRSRCVVIDYNNDYHIDIIPCLTRDGKKYICNKNTDLFEVTDGTGYDEWLQEKNKFVGNNYLIRSIQLFKYLRDIKQTFSCKSILLTTLITKQVEKLIDEGFDKNELFSDLPITFKNLMNSLNEFLQSCVIMPIIKNPVLDEENFNRHWNEEKFKNFKSCIERYNGLLNEAFDEVIYANKIEKLKSIFGQEFPDPLKEEKQLAINSFELNRVYEKHKWIVVQSNHFALNCKLYKNKNSGFISEIENDKGMITKGKWLKFEIDKYFNLKSYKFYWQVLNTDDESKNDRRGDIFVPTEYISNNKVHWESTKYKGRHWIECYAVMNGKFCFRSERFYVNII